MVVIAVMYTVLLIVLNVWLRKLAKIYNAEIAILKEQNRMLWSQNRMLREMLKDGQCEDISV